MRGLGTGVGDVLRHRAVEQRRVLGHERDGAAQALLGDARDVVSVDEDAALVHAVAVLLRDQLDEAGQQALQAGGVLLGEQVGQRALHVLPPQGDFLRIFG